LNLTPVPLQFASAGHLETRLRALAIRAAAVEGLSPRSVAWMHVGVRCLVRFLRATNAEARFVSGIADDQMTVLQDWVAWQRSNGLGRTTVATYWRGTAAAFQRLEADTAMFNPFAMLRAPRPGRPLPRCLTCTDAERLLVAVHHAPWRSSFERARNVAMVGLMLMAGLRRGEVLRLRFGDVDVAARTIHVHAGKGRHGGKDRTAYATPQLAAMLEAYRAERRRAGKVSETFITSTRDDAPIGEVTVRRVFRRLSAIIKVHVSPHMLRHTYATLLRQSGVSDRVAQELLGHSSLAALQRYSHVYEGECASESARLRFDV
jgi:integrase/recombinase XerD